MKNDWVKVTRIVKWSGCQAEGPTGGRDWRVEAVVVTTLTAQDVGAGQAGPLITHNTEEQDPGQRNGKEAE